MRKFNKNIKDLQRALNAYGQKIQYNAGQFWSDYEQRNIQMYSITQRQYDEEKEIWRTVELYRTSSQIRIVFFLRDLLNLVTGKELPTDNTEWNKYRAKIPILNDK